jgi:hypothetical protein
MALSGAALGALIDSNLAAAGAIGSNRTVFSNAVGNGIVNHIVGKSFTTTDVGTIPGTGAGIGTGITGLADANMTSLALSTMSSTGSNAFNLMDAIMRAVVTHLSSSATLTSTHSPVFAGSGIVDVGSIPVVIAGMQGTILAELNSAGAIGVNRSNLSLAIATGVVTEILSAGTGTVTITGSPSGIPVGGGGVGAGVIS